MDFTSSHASSGGQFESRRHGDTVDFRARAWIRENNSVPVEALYRDYTDFNGVKFPTLITEKRGGELSLILVVGDVRAD